MAGRRIEVRGTVQGVGFRPWVYRLAQRLGIRGRVRNDPRGVTIDAFAAESVITAFIKQLQSDVPSSARILELEAHPIPDEPLEGFVIQSSDVTGAKALSIPPDLATCPQCLAEVLDPADRRYGYAFTNCTSCGPRFTIATGIPYDRAATTMRKFDLCAACRHEYDDIEDRRFHAQPNACPKCGPTLSLTRLDGDALPATDPLKGTADLLKRGAVVAVKGLGGFHLACDASDAAAVRLLRERKHRDEKPLAVMIADLDAAKVVAAISAEEEALLTAPERPIVIVRAIHSSSIAAEVSPETPFLGLFLPYTPLHHLLLEAVAKLADRFAIELVICGEGPQRARLEAVGGRLPAGTRLLLPGFVANPFAWMASADIFALASDVEGLPNALVEAQGLGVGLTAEDLLPNVKQFHGRHQFSENCFERDFMSEIVDFLVVDNATLEELSERLQVRHQTRPADDVLCEGRTKGETRLLLEQCGDVECHAVVLVLLAMHDEVVIPHQGM